MGKDKVALTLHSDAVARHSTASNALVNAMRAATSRTEDLLDTDPETFVRFSEFAYTGDYTPPDFEEVPDEPTEIAGTADNAEPADLDLPTRSSLNHNDLTVADTVPDDYPARTEPPAVTDHSDWDSWAFSSRGGKKKKKSSAVLWSTASPLPPIPAPEAPAPRRVLPPRLQDLIRETRYERPAPREESTLHAQMIANENPNENFSPVFLGHAKVYVFAEKYDIKQLSDLALYKLSTTLSAFTIFESRFGDIADLVRFTYGNTNDYVESVDSLRKLVVQYVAKVSGQLAEDTFLELLAEGGEFVKDLWVVMREGYGKS